MENSVFDGDKFKKALENYIKKGIVSLQKDRQIPKDHWSKFVGLDITKTYMEMYTSEDTNLQFDSFLEMDLSFSIPDGEDEKKLKDELTSGLQFIFDSNEVGNILTIYRDYTIKGPIIILSTSLKLGSTEIWNPY